MHSLLVDSNATNSIFLIIRKHKQLEEQSIQPQEYHNLRKFKQNTLIKGTTNYNQRLWFNLSLRPLTSIYTCLKPYFAKHNEKTIYCGNYKQKIPPA